MNAEIEMPLLLRFLRVNRWIKAEAAPLLEAGDLPSDSLGDLVTSNNGLLSVWRIQDDQSNLERVVRAYAITKDRIADIGYVLFDSNLLEPVGIEMVDNPGTTPDKVVNLSHCDLKLTGNKVIALARLLYQAGMTDTMLKRHLEALVAAGIDRGELPEKCREKLKK